MKYIILGLAAIVAMAVISNQLFIHMYSILQEL
jgi:hypothetical protein